MLGAIGCPIEKPHARKNIIMSIKHETEPTYESWDARSDDGSCFACDNPGERGPISEYENLMTRQFCQDCQVRLSEIERSFMSFEPDAGSPKLPGELTIDDCPRCRVKQAAFRWEFSRGFEVSLCSACEIELMRRLIRSQGSEDWESKFIEYITRFWEYETATVGTVQHMTSLIEAISRLEAEGKWPPDRLRNRVGIANWRGP